MVEGDEVVSKEIIREITGGITQIKVEAPPSQKTEQTMRQLYFKMVNRSFIIQVMISVSQSTAI